MNKPTRLRRWLSRLTTIAIALAVVGGGLRGALRRKPLGVRVVSVDRGPVRDVVTSSTAGEIAGELHATVRAEVGAQVAAVRHRRGERVRRGELVVVLSDTDLTARLAQARAALPAQQGQLEQAKARVATLERQAARARMLVERGAGAAQASEDADNLLREAREALRAQSGVLDEGHAAVRVAQVALERTRLAAPFDGLLVDVLPDPGEELTPGAPAFEIIDDSRLHVDASVDEADAARVAVGQPAVLTLDALPGRRIPGRLSKIAPALRRDLKGARTLPVEVEVTDPAGAMAAGLKPGMSTNVEIVVTEKASTVWLPTNVIVSRGVKRTVYQVAERDESGARRVLAGLLGLPLRLHQARVVEVKVGLANWERTEIVSGVEPGATVVSTLNVKGLEDGAAVKVEN
jgi:HlyD family secretion protein